MVFNLLLLVLLVIIAFFHYVQGAFSAFLSAVAAAVATAVAFGLYENVIVSLLGGKAADLAIAMSLVGLFALAYLVLRLILDKAIPGNVRLPVTADRIAAGCFGVVAGLFSVGTLAVAAQTLPTGTYTIDFSRFATAGSRTVAMFIGGGVGVQPKQDIELRGEFESPVAAEETRKSLWVPMDSFAVNFIGFQSSRGALAGSNDFRKIHPDFLAQQQLARAGSEAGQKITTLTRLGGQDRVKVEAAYLVTSPLQQIDGEIDSIRKRNLPAMLQGDSSRPILILRVLPDDNETDKDNILRFSPGAVRLNIDGVNLFPLGTLTRGRLVIANAIDDPIRADPGPIDFVFQVEANQLVQSSNQVKLLPGSFIEFRRLGRVSLDGVTADVSVLPPDVAGPVRRKEQIETKIAELIP